MNIDKKTVSFELSKSIMAAGAKQGDAECVYVVDVSGNILLRYRVHGCPSDRHICDAFDHDELIERLREYGTITEHYDTVTNVVIIRFDFPGCDSPPYAPLIEVLGDLYWKCLCRKKT